ncbi:protein phosphatase Slingshot homolog 1 [Ambystoma mexicanum]|uniref:protein phosphatase Slingshot homolog 1 n=1 Tax=Ambystoma mexicanum TaxID=8296 RepID=UPI0037E9C0D0
MALVTLQRSPTPSAASSASTSEEVGSDEERKSNLSLSESFFMVKGAALFLQQGNSTQGHRSILHLHKHAGDLPQHLQVMINLLRSEDRIKLAVRLESQYSDRVRYMVVVYSSGRQDTEENVLLGMDFTSKESKQCTIGMVLHLWSDTKIHLDGDGGFSVSTAGRTHIFKPVSVQAMWSALQILHKACEVARRYNYFPGGIALVWATYYESCIGSDQSSINEWNVMLDLESTRPDSPVLFADKPTEGERTECVIKAQLRSIMMSKDLENITCKEIRTELEKKMNCNLKEYKEYIDNEMLLILGQMDKPTLIFDYLYLGSEWNASNLEELQDTGVGYILNVTREIDNFFPGLFAYHNIRVYDEDATDLLAHWNEAYNFITKAKKNNSKCLVHCKMGVSRSASTVIAYAMKEFDWPLEKAYNFVKQKRTIARPNAGFMRQLSEYEGILDASKQRHNKLWKHMESNMAASENDTTVPSMYQSDILDAALQGNLCEECNMDAAQPCTHSYSKDNLPPLELAYTFKSLSESCLEKKGEAGDVQIEDLERDSILDEESTAGKHSMVSYEFKEEINPKLKPEPLAEKVDFCDTEVRKKLDFLNNSEIKSIDLNLNPESSKLQEQMPKELQKTFSVGKDEDRINTENANNNNSKRSYPDEFERDAIFGILRKVKPPYQSCTDCMYSPSVTSDLLNQREILNEVDVPCTSTICTQPSLLLRTSSSLFDNMPRKPLKGVLPPTVNDLLPHSLGEVSAKDPPIAKSVADHQEGVRETHKSLQNSTQSASAATNPVRGNSQPCVDDDSMYKRDSTQAKDLRYVLFSKELEKPTSNSYLMQHQESIIQLQKAGLVRKHTKELERLKSDSVEERSSLKENATNQMENIPEVGVDLGAQQAIPSVPRLILSGREARGSLEISEHMHHLDGVLYKTSTPYLYRTEQISSFSKEFLKTICYTPASSSVSSNLTRSSSSDSIHSVHGKPGLVKQRTQEFETRLRLAGVTLSSPLKRSNSLARLGSLTFSTEDIAGDVDMMSLSDPNDATFKDISLSHKPHSTPKKREPFFGPLNFPGPRNFNNTSNIEKS